MKNESLQTALGDEGVIIEGVEPVGGAQREAPQTAGRGSAVTAQYVPTTSVIDLPLQAKVADYLYRQAAILDGKCWQDFIDLFDQDGIYWMPVEPSQTDWLGQPSIFSEDKLIMEIRRGRILHPNAWSQAPMWETNHMVSNVILERVTDTQIDVYSRFQMMELRRDDVRHFGGIYRHQLLRDGDSFRIKMQRVDMMNGQATFDYVLQAWV